MDSRFDGRGQRNRMEPGPIVGLAKADFVQIEASHAEAERLWAPERAQRHFAALLKRWP